MMTPLDAHVLDSKSQLLAHVDPAGRNAMLLGTDEPAPDTFCAFTVTTPHGPRVVGVLSAFQGYEPAAVQTTDGRRVLVGHGATVHAIDVAAMRASATLELPGAFYEFLPIGEGDDALVVHEFGVTRIDADGRVAWEMRTESTLRGALLTDDGELTVRTKGDPDPLVVTLGNGLVKRVDEV